MNCYMKKPSASRRLSYIFTQAIAYMGNQCDSRLSVTRAVALRCFLCGEDRRILFMNLYMRGPPPFVLGVHLDVELRTKCKQ